MNTPHAVSRNEKQEGVERLGRAHPGELVGAEVDYRTEILGVALADGGVDAIGGHDQVGALHFGQAGDLVAELERHAEGAGTGLQQHQQRAPGTAAETVAADAMHRCPYGGSRCPANRRTRG